MERRNYFEMLGLDFDPPEKNDRAIQKAIAAWKKRTEDMLGSEDDKVRRSVLSAAIASRRCSPSSQGNSNTFCFRHPISASVPFSMTTESCLCGRPP